MSVARPLVPRPAWPLTMAGAGDDGDDPIRRRLVSTHEADVEPINRGVMEYACEQCLLAFASLDAVKAHHLRGKNDPNLYVRLIFDPRHRHVFVELFTEAQVEAAVRAFQGDA